MLARCVSKREEPSGSSLESIEDAVAGTTVRLPARAPRTTVIGAMHQPPLNRGVAELETYLCDHGLAFDMIEHERTERAIAEARATNVPPEQTAKTVVLRVGDGYRFAVLPASERLDLHKAADALELSRHDVHLASEAEMAADFPEYDVGAVPPLGPRTPPELLDRRLLDYGHVLCHAGDHEHSLLMNPDDIVRIAHARVLDLCAD
jgi:Ala-tRNA(Pro) deacylase